LPFAEPASYKDSLSTGKTVLLTFGLLSPNKGFENVIQALPRILSRHSNVVYIIAGATQPMSDAARAIDIGSSCRPWQRSWELGRVLAHNNQTIGARGDFLQDD
jgi:glycosyltransferase involved in cell wall biosynthesis